VSALWAKFYWWHKSEHLSCSCVYVNRFLYVLPNGGLLTFLPGLITTACSRNCRHKITRIRFVGWLHVSLSSERTVVLLKELLFEVMKKQEKRHYVISSVKELQKWRSRLSKPATSLFNVSNTYAHCDRTQSAPPQPHCAARLPRLGEAQFAAIGPLQRSAVSVCFERLSPLDRPSFFSFNYQPGYFSWHSQLKAFTTRNM